MTNSQTTNPTLIQLNGHVVPEVAYAIRAHAGMTGQTIGQIIESLARQDPHIAQLLKMQEKREVNARKTEKPTRELMTGLTV